jgi:uncharacterized protein YjdB
MSPLNSVIRYSATTSPAYPAIMAITAQPIQLTATITPSDPDDPAMTWTTSNDMVAGVDENGLVTLTGGYGTAVITARAASGAEAKYTVNVVLELPDESEENAQPQTTKEENR